MISLSTNLLNVLAPYYGSQSYKAKVQTLSVTRKFNPVSVFNLSAKFYTYFPNISLIYGSYNELKTIISSNLLINSGGKRYFNYIKAYYLAYSNISCDLPAASINY